MVRAEDLGEYYRIGSDARDLNYSLYFEKGETQGRGTGGLHLGQHPSAVATRNCEELLLKLDYVQQELETDAVTLGGHA